MAKKPNYVWEDDETIVVGGQVFTMKILRDSWSQLSILDILQEPDDVIQKVKMEFSNITEQDLIDYEKALTTK